MQKDMFPEQLPRPKESDPGMIEKAAKSFAKQMNKEWPDYSEEEWAEALESVYSSVKDGYQMAKDIEREGFDPDVEMVNRLDDFGYEVSKTVREAVREWVKNVGFTPEFAIGDKVNMGFSRHQPETGKVTGIRHESAEYEVKSDEEANRTYIIKAENLKRVENVEG